MENYAPNAQPHTAILIVRSLLYAAGQGLLSVPFSIAAILALVLPYRLRYALVSRWTHCNLWWLEKTCRLHHSVVGEENIPQQPIIIFCKHESAWETLALQLYFTPQVWVIKRELLWMPFFGWGLATLRPIAIDRSSNRAALGQILTQGRATGSSSAPVPSSSSSARSSTAQGAAPPTSIDWQRRGSRRPWTK